MVHLTINSLVSEFVQLLFSLDYTLDIIHQKASNAYVLVLKL